MSMSDFPFWSRNFGSKTFLSLSFLVGISALSSAGCTAEHKAAPESAKFAVTSPVRKDIELTKEYVAQIRAIQHIDLQAIERGYLTEVFVDEGQHVEKGQKMFQIMPLIYQAELEKAEAEAELTRIEYQNTKTLSDRKVVSTQELALSKAKVDKAQAELDLAKAHRALTEIHAPFDGIMGRFQVRLGSLIDEGELLTTLADNSTIWVYFNASETEYLEYKSRSEAERSRPVKLVMANGKEFDQPGKIETIEADFNNETGNIAFRAAFPNPEGLLRHGETGKVVMGFPIHDALLIPQKATFEVLDRRYVFTLDDKNVVRSQPILVTAEIPHLFILGSGLDEKQRILLEGLRKVTDGDEIEADYRKPEEVIAGLELPAE